MTYEQELRELHEAAVAVGAIYEKRQGLKWMSRVGYEYHMQLPQPMCRKNYSDDQDSPIWLEWHRVRGIDPYAYRSRGYKLSERIRRTVIARDGFVCGLCGGDVEPSDVHIDHILPRLLGGCDDLDNLQVAHSFCNISKGARV